MNRPARPPRAFFALKFVFPAIILLFAAAPHTATAGEDVLSALPIGQVEVGGEIGRRIDVTVQNNLNQLDLEKDFIKPFRVKDRNGGFYGTGMLVDAAVGLAAYSQDKEALRRKNLLVEEMIKLQDADGYAGYYKPSRRLWHPWDIHEMSYLMEGWLREYRLFGNRRALEAAMKTADYIVNRWSAEPERVCDSVTHTDVVVTGLEAVLLDLYEQSGKKKYLDFVIDVRKLPQWDHTIVLGRWGDIRGHAYAYMARCIAQLKLARIENDEKLLRSSRELLDFLLHENGMAVSGACGYHECWHDTQEGTSHLGETCASAYLLRLLHEMTLMQGHSCYGDIMERVLFNTLFAAQSPEGRKIRYYTPFDGDREYFHVDSYCCPNNYRRIISEIPKLIYYRCKGGLVVNLYGESSAEIELPGGATLAVRQETDYPTSGKVSLHVDPSAPAEFPLWLRIPAWCEQASVKIRGRSDSDENDCYKVKGGAFLKITRTWRPQDLVEIDMPMRLRLVKGRQRQAGCVALMRGPQVFCLDPAKNKNLANLDLHLLVIDPCSIEGPIKDSSVRAGGLAYRVKVYHRKQARSDLSLLLTEFTDPQGKAIYFKVPNPRLKTLVDDELTQLELP